jgi:hypothetical protein
MLNINIDPSHKRERKEGKKKETTKAKRQSTKERKNS